MQKLTFQIRKQEPRTKKNKVMMPNDPEIHCAKIRSKNGIPLDNETFLQLKKLSQKFNVQLNCIN